MKLHDNIKKILKYLAGDELKNAIATAPNPKLKGRFSYDKSLSYEKNLISALKAIQSYPELKYELNLYNVSNIKSFFDLLKKWGINGKLRENIPQEKSYKTLISNLWQIYIETPETFIFTLYLDTVKCPGNGKVAIGIAEKWTNEFCERYSSQNPDSLITFSQDDAFDLIEDFYFNIKNRAVIITGREKVNVINCQYCGEEVAEKASSCPHCTIVFKSPKCPICGESLKSGSKLCSKCGLKFSDYRNILADYNKAKDAYGVGKFWEAERILEVILKSCKYPDAQSLIELCKNVRKEAELKEAEELKKRNEEKKRLEEERKQIETELKAIRPPEKLTAEALSSKIVLKWSPTSSKNIDGYKITRKVGGAPSAIDDGELITASTMTSLSFEDTNLKIGTIYHYGVFPIYKGIPASVSASSRAVYILGDVENLKVVPSNESATLVWKMPQGAESASVILSRKGGENDFENRDIGKGISSFEDIGLKNGEVYSYTVKLRFDNISKSAISNGIEIETVPNVRATRIIPKLSNVITKRVGELIEISWEFPEEIEEAFICVSEKENPEFEYILKNGKAIAKTDSYGSYSLKTKNVTGFLNLYASSGTGENRVLSESTCFEILSHPLQISYKVIKSKKSLFAFWRKKENIIFITSTGQNIPGLDVVFSEKSVPLKRQFGIQKTTIEKSSANKKEYRLDSPQSGYVRLFLSNLADSCNYTLRHPAHENAKI